MCWTICKCCFFGCSTICCVFIIITTFYMGTYFKQILTQLQKSALTPSQQAIAATFGDKFTDAIINDQFLIFKPKGFVKNNIGILITPQGLVKPQCYAPFASIFAQKGYSVVIPKMPFDLPWPGIINFQRIKSNPKLSHIENWFVGGHSFGIQAVHYILSDDKVRGVLYLDYYQDMQVWARKSQCHIVLNTFNRNNQKIDAYEKKTYKRNPKITHMTTIQGSQSYQFASFDAQEKPESFSKPTKFTNQQFQEIAAIKIIEMITACLQNKKIGTRNYQKQVKQQQKKNLDPDDEYLEKILDEQQQYDYGDNRHQEQYEFDLQVL